MSWTEPPIWAFTDEIQSHTPSNVEFEVIYLIRQTEREGTPLLNCVHITTFCSTK